jgi:hypothetical protein
MTRTRLRLGRGTWPCLLAIAGLLAGCMIPIPTVQPLTVIDPVEEVQTLGMEGASRAVVRLRLLSRTLLVRGFDDPLLLRGRFRYNVQEWAPNFKQETSGDRTEVTVGQGLGSQIPLGRQDAYQNAWEIELGRGLPLDLGVDMGAGEAFLDLTGLWLSGLSVTSGSTDLVLAFGGPNPEPLGTLRLTAGTGKVTATGLGHANFDQLSVLGGAGAVDLDFSGAFHRSAMADIKAGAGKVTIRVPANIGVRATLGGVPLGEVDAIGFSMQGDDVYVNAAYGIAPLTLTIKIATGVGSISLVSE